MENLEEAIKDLPLGQSVIMLQGMVLDDIYRFIDALDKNDKIKDAQKLKYHMRDVFDWMLARHWKYEATN